MAEQPRGSTPATAVVAALGATLLVVLLAAWAASIGPDELFRGDGPTSRGEAEETLPTPSGTVPTASPSDPVDRFGDPPAWLNAVALLTQLALLGVLVFVVATMARRTSRRRRARRRPPAQPSDVDFDVVDVDRVAAAIVSDAVDQRMLLLDGVPRNGIVACWHRFELQAATIGLAREPWETSSEFTLRLLDLVSAEPLAVGELAALYREARFSDHELGEDSRARAVAALDEIHRQMGGRLGRTSRAR